MNKIIIKKASKQSKKLRVMFSASSGSGKTYGALLVAYGLCGDWNKICVIDTERDSASLYSDLGDYSTISLSAPYTPERYIECIKAAETAGFDVIIIDSITHEWASDGGCLDIVAKLGGEFRHWGSVTPRHNKFIDAILTSSSHVFCTVRRKEEYAISQGANGKTQIQKLGLGEIQRDGISYEMDLVFEITNSNHLAKASKDRTGIFVERPEFLLSTETGTELKNWASKGRSDLDDAMDLVRSVTSLEELKDIYSQFPYLHNNDDFLKGVKLKKEEFKLVEQN